MNTKLNNQKITDTEKRFLQAKEQHEIILKAQRKIQELDSIGFYVYHHPTVDIDEYEKHMNDYLNEKQKSIYQKWKEEYPDMANFYTRED
ncbi:hypothetical protein ACE193_21065 [Bernardetia sp. OM2101]|uniref:hypothetical protein n=1 Tax=Bernardetia sp. OM2101 TaxID=3344876 RepID=UPI0035D129F4